MSLFIHDIGVRRPRRGRGTRADAARQQSDLAGWTEDREKRLRTLWDEGASAARIAKEFGCTRNAVIGKARRLKLAARQERLNPRPFGFDGGVATRVKHAMRRREQTRQPPSLEVVRIPKKLPAPEKSDYAVSLADRQSGQCTWPLWGDVLPAEPMFCGAPVKGESCWCPKHFKIGTTRPRNTK